MILLLADEEKAPSLLRLLPFLAMAGLILFRWLSEKIKKKENEQRAEEEQRYQRERQEDMTRARRTGPVQQPSARRVPASPQRPQPAEKIHRYQPQIPAAPAPPDWRRPQPAESEQIVMAEDITAALQGRQLSQQQSRQQLRIQAARRAKALKDQRRQQAAELRAAKAAAQQRTRSLHDGDVVAAELVSVPAGVLAPTQITVSHAKLRQAVVWAEILGPPRALRTYSFAY